MNDTRCFICDMTQIVLHYRPYGACFKCRANPTGQSRSRDASEGSLNRSSSRYIDSTLRNWITISSPLSYGGCSTFGSCSCSRDQGGVYHQTSRWFNSAASKSPPLSRLLVERVCGSSTGSGDSTTLSLPWQSRPRTKFLKYFFGLVQIGWRSKSWRVSTIS